MSVRWTQKALADLDSIYDAVSADRPLAAKHVLLALFSCAQNLSRHPRQGRPGRLSETRELSTPRLPYVFVYSLRSSPSRVAPDVVILRVVHGAMNWPPEDR